MLTVLNNLFEQDKTLCELIIVLRFPLFLLILLTLKLCHGSLFANLFSQKLSTLQNTSCSFGCLLHYNVSNMTAFNPKVRSTKPYVNIAHKFTNFGEESNLVARICTVCS